MSAYKRKPSALIKARFPFELTQGQEAALAAFDDFITDRGIENRTILLKGYAGTGKTTFLGAVINSLPMLGYRVQLLAPTGRASKVMAQYSGKTALTIHKRIYSAEYDSTGNVHYRLQKNSFKNTVFVVDEASMIGNHADYGSRGLLADLVRYVFEDQSNKLVFAGDTAQLPPVGSDLSPALDAETLANQFGLSVTLCELTEVVRQLDDSGILSNATHIRALQKGNNNTLVPTITTKGFPDVFKMQASKIQDGLNYAYEKFGTSETVVITHTNRMANKINQLIRTNIFWREDEIESDDRVVIVKNNYVVSTGEDNGNFLANGDLAVIKKVYKIEEAYGYRFADIDLKLSDDADEETIRAKAILQVLMADAPALTLEQTDQLRKSIIEDFYEDDLSLEEALKNNEYIHALQIKFGYALTCHKAQGGQWDAVFVEAGMLSHPKIPQEEKLRWLYTAITRARKELYFINLPEAWVG
jgi:exodeoxyribonuclease-5